MTKIQHDSTLKFEYAYSGDGVRVLKKDDDAQQEYRYRCSIDCSGTPLRVYQRALGSNDPWQSLEDYVPAPTFTWYNQTSDYPWLAGHWLRSLDPQGGSDMYYQDWFGVPVESGGQSLIPAPPPPPLPEYLDEDSNLSDLDLYLPFGPVYFPQQYVAPSQGKRKGIPKNESPCWNYYTRCVAPGVWHDGCEDDCMLCCNEVCPGPSSMQTGCHKKVCGDDARKHPPRIPIPGSDCGSPSGKPSIPKNKGGWLATIWRGIKAVWDWIF